MNPQMMSDSVIRIPIRSNEMIVRQKAFSNFLETNGAVLESIYKLFDLKKVSLKEWIVFAYEQTSTDGLQYYID